MQKNNLDWKIEALRLNNQNMSWREIARIINVPRSTVSDFLRAITKQNIITEDAPRTLLIDIETAPSAAYIWKRWKENVGVSQVISEGYILTYSAKWFGDSLMLCNRIKNPEDDRAIVEEIAGLLEQAHVVVAHNSKKFDIPTIYARMAYHGMLPPSPVKVVDTLEIAKKAFRFPSNSLDSIAAYLGLDRKLSHSGFDLWKRCMQGENEAFEELLEYNRQDVEVLEQVYDRLAPWSYQHQNMSAYYNDGEMHCPLCGSTSLTKTSKSYYTQQSEFDAYRCSSCGKVSRGKQNKRTKQSMKNTLVNMS